MVEPELILSTNRCRPLTAMRKELREELKAVEDYRLLFLTHSREEMKVLGDEALFMKAGRQTGHIDFAAKNGRTLDGEPASRRSGSMQTGASRRWEG
jgi:ABC-type sulfate/molybdate transport systems ATPase subunit